MTLEKCPKCGNILTTLSSSGRQFCTSCKWTETKENKRQSSQHKQDKISKFSINNNLERIITIISIIIVITISIKFISPNNANKSVEQVAKKEEPQAQINNPNPQPDQSQLETVNSQQEQQKSEVLDSQIETESRKTVTKYLDDITQKGSSGYGYWCQSSQELLSSLYAPRSYQILDEFESGSSASYTVRIESSTKGGFPVISNWSIYMKKESNNWCVALLSEKQ